MHRVQVLDTCLFSFVLFSLDLNSIDLSFSCYPVFFSNPICISLLICLFLPFILDFLSVSVFWFCSFFFLKSVSASPIPSGRLRAAVSPAQEPAALHDADSDDGSQASPLH